MSFVRSLSKLFFVLVLLAGVSQAQVAAVVSDQVGTASYRTDGEWKALGVLSSLPAGATIRLSEGATTTLSFLKGGRVVHLSGPCLATMTSESVSTKSQVQVKEVARVEGSPLPRSVNFDRMGGQVRVDESAPTVTNDSVLLDSEPELEWEFNPDSAGFTVVVLDAETEVEVLSAQAPPEARSLKLVGLQRGVDYLVLLSTRTEKDAYETQHPLVLLTKEEVERVEKAEKRAAEGDFSDKTSLLSLYLDLQLWSPARPLVETLLEQRPNDPNLLQLRELLQ